MTSAIAERGFGGRDADVHLGVRQAEVRVRQRLPFGEPRLLVVGQQLNVHVHAGVPVCPELVKYFSISRDEKGQIPRASAPGYRRSRIWT